MKDLKTTIKEIERHVSHLKELSRNLKEPKSKRTTKPQASVKTKPVAPEYAEIFISTFEELCRALKANIPLERLMTPALPSGELRVLRLNIFGRKNPDEERFSLSYQEWLDLKEAFDIGAKNTKINELHLEKMYLDDYTMSFLHSILRHKRIEVVHFDNCYVDPLGFEKLAKLVKKGCCQVKKDGKLISFATDDASDSQKEASVRSFAVLQARQPNDIEQNELLDSLRSQSRSQSNNKTVMPKPDHTEASESSSSNKLKRRRISRSHRKHHSHSQRESDSGLLPPIVESKSATLDSLPSSYRKHSNYTLNPAFDIFQQGGANSRRNVAKPKGSSVDSLHFARHLYNEKYSSQQDDNMQGFTRMRASEGTHYKGSRRNSLK